MELNRWWNEAVFYHILVDRFRREGAEDLPGNPGLPEFCGGNLQGVIEQLPYLRKLGVTALLLSPINCTASYHGYHVTNYEDVEPSFGGKDAFLELMKAAKPDFHIVMDWVPNHVHEDHQFFKAAGETKQSRYRHWFQFDRAGHYRCYLDFRELPKLNLDHPEVRQYMIQCCMRWLDLGVDGFRLDHALGPSLEFWREFRTAIKRSHPSALLLGEVTLMGIKRKHLSTLNVPHKRLYFMASKLGFNVTGPVMHEYLEVFDALLDFQFQTTLKEGVAYAEEHFSRRRIQALLDSHYATFPEGYCLPSFLDNHDMNRFLFEARGDKRKLKQAAEIQFSQPQPPIIYYGTEVGLCQTHAISGIHGDLQARQAMPWRDQDSELLQLYKDLIHQWKKLR